MPQPNSAQRTKLPVTLLCFTALLLMLFFATMMLRFNILRVNQAQTKQNTIHATLALLNQLDELEVPRTGPEDDTAMSALVLLQDIGVESVAQAAHDESTLCDAQIAERVKKYKELQATAGVTPESVKAEMARRPGMIGRLVIPGTGINVALITTDSQATVDARDSAWYGVAGSATLIADHWNQGFNGIKSCSAGSKAYIISSTGKRTLTCTGIDRNGTNTSYDLLNSGGASVLGYGGIIMYTCNGPDWHSVTITYWAG